MPQSRFREILARIFDSALTTEVALRALTAPPHCAPPHAVLNAPAQAPVVKSGLSETAHVQALFNRIDSDESGQISWDEFWTFVEKEACTRCAQR